jgi:hypothetical protein
MAYINNVAYRSVVRQLQRQQPLLGSSQHTKGLVGKRCFLKSLRQGRCKLQLIQQWNGVRYAVHVDILQAGKINELSVVRIKQRATT